MVKWFSLLSSITFPTFFLKQQDGGVEGRALIFSYENSKITTCCLTTNDRRMLAPPKKNTPHPRAKEKPQQEGRRDEIALRIKPHTHQRCSEGSSKTLCIPGDPTDPRGQTEPDLCLSVSFRGTGQQWAAAWEGALGAPDVGVAEALLKEVAINPNIELPRTYTGVGNQTLGGRKQNFVHTRTQEKRAVTSQETDPDMHVSVQKSLAEAWVRSGLLQGQGH